MIRRCHGEAPFPSSVTLRGISHVATTVVVPANSPAAFCRHGNANSITTIKIEVYIQNLQKTAENLGRVDAWIERYIAVHKKVAVVMNDGVAENFAQDALKLVEQKNRWPNKLLGTRRLRSSIVCDYDLISAQADNQ